MAKIVEKDRTHWENYHLNYRLSLSKMIKVMNHLPGKTKIEKYIDSSKALEGIAKRALTQKATLRPFGNRWSLSKIPHTQDWMLDTRSLNLKWDIDPIDTHSNYKGDRDQVLFTQCGNYIKELNKYLGERNRSLKTCGASNGQTIAGAVSTGVHGAAIDFGSMQDFVVGIHLIIKPGKNVYLERKSYPVLKDTYVANLNTKVIRDDKLFNAALVSFGCFGIIHGLVIETEPIYALRTFIKKIDIPDAKHLMNTLDFKNSGFQMAPSDKIPYHLKHKPFHLKYYVNQYVLMKNKKNAIRVEIMFKDNLPANYTPPEPNSKGTYRKDIPGFIGKFTDLLSSTIPGIANILNNQVFPKYGKKTFATLGDTFNDTSSRGKNYAAAFAIPIEKSSLALSSIISLIQDGNKIPGLIAMRFVPRSKALLGFTKFKMNCVLDLDGVNSKGFQKFVEQIPPILEKNKIPFTFHWGKNNAWSAEMVDKMYGPRKKEWKTLRSDLLGKQACKTYSSPFISYLGLDDFTPSSSPIA